MPKKNEPLKGKIKIHEPEAEALKLFIEAWKEKSGKDYVESFPFANQDNWTGTSVMEFAKFIVRRKNEDIKSAVQGLEEGIERCIQWAECQADLSREDMLTQLKEDIETEIKKWFPDIIKEGEEDGKMSVL